ncbi:MAG: SET domain-containing protein [Chloroflexota bacterium]|nr:SET domain-containing protein [Chloroflexota bacterium]
MDVEVRRADRKGLGVFARRPFPKDALILRFSGQRVGKSDLPALTEWEREHLGEVDVGIYQMLPEPRCYANHACSPNAVSTTDTLYALREIREGEEITIDYRLNAYDDGTVWEMRCDCGAEEGPHTVLGDFFSLPAERQRRTYPWRRHSSSACTEAARATVSGSGCRKAMARARRGPCSTRWPSRSRAPSRNRKASKRIWLRHL